VGLQNTAPSPSRYIGINGGDVKSGILEILILKQRYNHLKLIPAYSLDEEISFTIPFANRIRASSI